MKISTKDKIATITIGVLLVGGIALIAYGIFGMLTGRP